MLKHALTLFFVPAVIFVAASPPHPCVCFPNWTAVSDPQSPGGYHCQDPHSTRTFPCNIDIPPVCHCREKGEIVGLPLGEMNCIGGGHNKYDNTNCETTPAWEAWFTKYPQYRLHQ